MSGLEIKAYAKINLSLDVLGKREDGYHELKTIMQTVTLHDTVYMDKTPAGISLDCGKSRIPRDNTNIAWKAASLIIRKYNIKSGLKIKIVKRIPVAAGLAGGSTDAAAVLRGMNQLFSLDLDNEELGILGKQIGADVPYCINGGTRLAEGIGEQLTVLPDFDGVDIVMVKPGIGVSTKWVYENLDPVLIGNMDRPDTALMGQAIARHDIKAVAALMKNVLEKVTVPTYPVIQEAKDKLIKKGAAGSMMSGSGPTVFGIFSDGSAAEKACSILSEDKRWQCYHVKTMNND